MLLRRRVHRETVGQTVVSRTGRRLVGLLIVLCLASTAGGIPRQQLDAKGRVAVVDEAEPRNHQIGQEEVEGSDLLPQQQQHKTGTSVSDSERGPQQNSVLSEDDARTVRDRPAADAVGTDAGTDDGEEMEMEEDDPSLRVAPKYMLELYRKFSTDKYSHPIANIVRSFLNINTGVLPIWTTGNRTRVALHTLLFNISSVNRDEEVHLAELRLFAARKTQRVLVYEVVHSVAGSSVAAGDEDPSSRHYELLTTREIARRGDHGDWETFAVTEVVRRWVRTQATAGHILEVRVDTTRPETDEDDDEEEGGDGRAEEDEEGGDVKSAFEPILVVFSNDRKRRKIELRELHEIQSHENGVGEEEEYAPPSPSSSSYPSSTSLALSGAEEEEEDYEDELEEREINATVPAGVGTAVDDEGDVRRRYPQLMESLSKSTGDRPPSRSAPRVKRSVNRNRRRRAKRNSCRRKPMWVDFGDVQWDRWIIEPRGYQAYECTGQCYFPVGEHLTPTKYAMIKSLLHATYPKRVAAVCCVPTKLEPISLLYIDEHGTVTYKYKYDGMVVAECGCR